MAIRRMQPCLPRAFLGWFISFPANPISAQSPYFIRHPWQTRLQHLAVKIYGREAIEALLRHGIQETSYIGMSNSTEAPSRKPGIACTNG
jgi:hypothetical protein